jgi:hypothetical protein
MNIEWIKDLKDAELSFCYIGGEPLSPWRAILRWTAEAYIREGVEIISGGRMTMFWDADSPAEAARVLENEWKDQKKVYLKRGF